MALTLSDELHDAIHALADALDKPAAKVVTQLLQEMLPQLQGMAKIARAGKEGNKAAAKRALQHLVGDSMARVISEYQQPDLPDLFKSTKRRSK